MAQNFKHPGKIMTFTAPTGGVTTGTAYLIGNLLVVALITAAAGASFTGDTVGVWTLPKHTGEAWTEGALLYWDDTNKYLTTTSTGNYRVGCAAAAAASGAATGDARLSGQPVPTGA